MDIGTSKPSRAVLDAVPHHLIDLCDPAEAYSAGRFRRDAAAAIAAIHARGRVPLLVGGTMLYFRALTRGIAPLPEADPALREPHRPSRPAARLAGAARRTRAQRSRGGRPDPARRRAADPARARGPGAHRAAPVDAAAAARAGAVRLRLVRPGAGGSRGAVCAHRRSFRADDAGRDFSTRSACCARAATCTRTCRACAPSAIASCGRIWPVRRASRPRSPRGSAPRAISPSGS